MYEEQRTAEEDGGKKANRTGSTSLQLKKHRRCTLHATRRKICQETALDLSILFQIAQFEPTVALN